MDLPVEKRETLNDLDESSAWPDKVRTLLDSYLREFGIVAEPVRTRWINRVIEKLDTRSGVVATEDMLEEAVERMRNLIEARVALIRGHDPTHDHKQIAQILVLLLDERYRDCLNMLFEHIEPDENIEHVRNALVTAMPIPVPEAAPLAMPVQTILLRSINPLRWLLGHST
jgi:hypothetical protein